MEMYPSNSVLTLIYFVINISERVLGSILALSETRTM